MLILQQTNIYNIIIYYYVNEDFLEFVVVDNLTGEDLSKIIIQQIEKNVV